jgi:hypothetical protein
MVPTITVGIIIFQWLMEIERISCSAEALELIRELEQQYGLLMFHQSGGCCDGSAPMCFEKGDFKVGASDVLLGEVGSHPFYMSRDQYEYWKHTHLKLDITPGRGSSFSLEIPTGKRFIIHSRLFTEEEYEQLKATGAL